MMAFIITVQLLLLLVTLLFRESVTMSEEKRLIKKLLSDYEKVGLIGRPVHDTSQTIEVQYGLGLIQILDLDEKNQVLTTNVWNTFQWTDILLRWKKEDFGNVSSIRIPSSKVWTPDVVLYNYADDRVSEQREALVIVDNEGNVKWMPMSVYKSTCDINIQNFPFDEQTCKMKFGSWTYDGDKLNLKLLAGVENVGKDDYEDSKEWSLVDTVAKLNIVKYSCCPEPYPDITFCIRIKRSSPYYMFVLIIPCILLSLLTLTIFWLPPEAPPKTLLAMSCFVSFFLLLRILANNIPRGSQTVPLIGVYFCTNMVMITVSSFMAITVIHISHRVDKVNKLPEWVKTVFFDHLARYLSMPNPPGRQQRKRQKQQQQQQHHTSAAETGIYRSTNSTAAVTQRSNHGYHLPPPYTTGIETRQSTRPEMGGPTYSLANNKESPIVSRQETPDRSPVIGRYLESDVKEIRRAFRAFHNRVARMDERARSVHEWRYLGEVLDRIFFIVYLLAVIVTLTTIMPWSKQSGQTEFNRGLINELKRRNESLTCAEIGI